jgi:hypothetical protein
MRPSSNPSTAEQQKPRTTKKKKRKEKDMGDFGR